jgi:hypothetical protein
MVSVDGSIENKRSRGWFQLTEASKRHTRLGIKTVEMRMWESGLEMRMWEG